MSAREQLSHALAAILDGARATDLEGSILDFKEDRGSRDETARSAADAAICFANAAGGAVVLGVADKVSGAAALTGSTLDVEWVRRRIHEMTMPGLLTDVEKITVGGVDLVAVFVPEGLDVYTDKKGRATRRMGNQCVPMSAAEVAQLQEERQGADWSSKPSERSIAAIDPLALGLARQLLGGSSDPARRELATLTDADLLAALGVVGQQGTLLRAGEVLFCSHDETETARIVYQYRATPAGDPVTVERVSDPLVLGFGKVLDWIRARLNQTPLNLPSGEQLQLEDFPSLAVREALSNAVVHRAYSRRGATQIEHSPQVFVVTSPGPLVAGVTPENILTTPSKPRNPTLAAAVRLLGFAEETGRGVDRMYREMVRVGKATPRIENQFDSVRVSLVGGAPNTQIARYVATLPEQERDDTDAMLLLFHLCAKATIKAEQASPVLQKTADEAEAVLRRLASDATAMIEPTRQTARRAHPTYRLRASVIQALGTAVPYRRRTVDDIDRKVIAHVREYGKISNQTIRNLFDVEVHPAKAILADLIARELLVRTSAHSRGPGVEYGPGRKFPKGKRAQRSRPQGEQDSLDLE